MEFFILIGIGWLIWFIFVREKKQDTDYPNNSSNTDPVNQSKHTSSQKLLTFQNPEKTIQKLTQKLNLVWVPLIRQIKSQSYVRIVILGYGSLQEEVEK